VFCKLLNKLFPQEFTADIETKPEFATNPERVKNRNALFGIINPVIKKKSQDFWLKTFDENGIPAGPILSIDKVVSHPQVIARDMIIEMQHSKAGKIKLTGIPVKLSETPGAAQTPPPTLGQHTEEVLKEILGYDEKTIQKLKRENVI
ncbi:MAG: CoA transferase, partial [Elusimicrobiota bacterium]